MNPEEQTLLSQAAANLYLEIWSIICTTVFYGIYLIAEIISIYLFISTDIAKHRIHPLPLTALLVAIFMTVDFVGRGCSVLILICRELMDSTTEVSLEKQFEAASHSGLVWSIILGWPQGILLLLSDFIVAWRAWAIWPTQRYVEVILVTVLVGSCVFRICDEVLYTLDIYFPGHNSTRSTLGVFNMLSLGFSIFTNIVSTFLLALKTWSYVATKRQLAVRYAKQTHSYQTLLLWVESGVLFGLFQIIFGVFQVLVSMTIINPKFIHPADAFLQALMKVVAALYPIAVFLIMRLRLSIVEECIMVQVQTSNNSS